MSEIETGHPEGGESNIIGPTEKADTAIHIRIEACLSGLNKLFAPPFNEEAGKDLVAAIRDQARCEAVSVFLSKQDPRRLDCLAGTGYDDSYSGLKCYLSDDKQYLTAYVFKNRRPVWGTYAEIAQDLKDDLPSVVEHAEFHLNKGPARNIIAMPIMSGAGRCYGVLNLENKEEALAENGRFTDADFSFASVVANLLGVAFQQRLYGKLVIDPPYEPRQKSPFSTQLEAIAQMLKLHVRAECVSIFVRRKDAQGKWILAYEAGVGYIHGYDLVYQWDDKTSFTVHVAHGKEPLRYTDAELVTKKNRDPAFPFTNQCIKWTHSGTFRNILAIPIFEDDEPLGVLKLENRLPEGENFNESDASFCNTFVQGPILALLKKNGPMAHAQTTTKGYRLLLDLLKGPPPAPGAKDRALIEEVRKTQKQHPNDITGNDCAAYLGIARATYYREIRPPAMAPGGSGGPSSA